MFSRSSRLTDLRENFLNGPQSLAGPEPPRLPLLPPRPPRLPLPPPWPPRLPRPPPRLKWAKELSAIVTFTPWKYLSGSSVSTMRSVEVFTCRHTEPGPLAIEEAQRQKTKSQRGLLLSIIQTMISLCRTGVTFTPWKYLSRSSVSTMRSVEVFTCRHTEPGPLAIEEAQRQKTREACCSIIQTHKRLKTGKGRPLNPP